MSNKKFTKTKSGYTTLAVKVATKEMLKNEEIYPGEPYDSIINRLVTLAKDLDKKLDKKSEEK